MPKKSTYSGEVWSMTITDYSEEVLRELDDAVERALEAIGEKATGYAQGECPVDTGLLRNSLTYGLDGQKAKLQTYKAIKGDGSGMYVGEFPKLTVGQRALYVGSNVHYAFSVETVPRKHKTGKAHFLKDAMGNHEDEYKNTIKASLEAAKG